MFFKYGLHLEAVVAHYHRAIRASSIRAPCGTAANLLIITANHNVVMATAWALIDPQLDARGHEINIVPTANATSWRTALCPVIFVSVQAYVTQNAALAPRKLLSMGVRNLQQHFISYAIAMRTGRIPCGAITARNSVLSEKTVH